MEYNLSELTGLRDWVGSNDAAFDYRTYARRTECGTTLCLAGKAAIDHGAIPLWRGSRPYSFTAAEEVAYICEVNGEERSIQGYATEVCGLTIDEADLLFAAETGTEEGNEHCALAFLDELIRRAESGMGSMEPDEVSIWYGTWYSAYYDD